MSQFKKNNQTKNINILNNKQQNIISRTNQIKKNHNKKLPKIGYEIIAGIFAGFFVSPMNTVVDKSVIQYANGKIPLWKGVSKGLWSFTRHPFRFINSFQFRWIFFVYGLTYSASNLAQHIKTPTGIDPAITKLLITFIVNSSASLIKDKALAQAFGTFTPKQFPKTALGCFLLRDILGMASAFTIPPIVADIIVQNFNINENTSFKIAQLGVPLLVQFIATPIHLLGLDLYNRQNLFLRQRLLYLKSIYTSSLLIRMMRFLPAYGLGGIVNLQLRNYFKEQKE